MRDMREVGHNKKLVEKFLRTLRRRQIVDKEDAVYDKGYK